MRPQDLLRALPSVLGCWRDQPGTGLGAQLVGGRPCDLWGWGWGRGNGAGHQLQCQPLEDTHVVCAGGGRVSGALLAWKTI